ncbi:MAG: hypothetical protein ACRDFT_04975, partial [bacterium]
MAAEDLSAYIDPEIQGYEREVMLDILTKLSPDRRQNVVYIDPLCQLFVNRVKLREVTEFLKLLGDNVYLTSWGQEVSMPSDYQIVDDGGDGGPPGPDGMSQMETLIDPYAITICEKPKVESGVYR